MVAILNGIGMHTCKTTDPITVTAAVIERNGLIFAARRSSGHLSGYWEFPGGKPEDGENPRDCLKRELNEEFGIEVEVRDFIGNSIYDYDTKIVKLLAFHVVHLRGAYSLTVHDAIRWLPRTDLWSVTWAPADVKLVKMVENNASTTER